jgi:hypothetical protein
MTLYDFGAFTYDTFPWLTTMNSWLGGWLGAGILFIFFIVLITIMKLYGFAEALSASLFITFILASLFYALQLINESILTLIFVLLCVSVAVLYLTRQ